MTNAGPLVAERDCTEHLNWVGNRPGRLTARQAEHLRTEYATARRSRRWTELAVLFDRYQAAGIAQARLGAALGVSAKHVHDLVAGHLPADHHRAPVEDWTTGEWITTAVAARLLDTSPAHLGARLRDADGITCKAGPRRVWHAPSLHDWWTHLAQADRPTGPGPGATQAAR